MKARRKWKRDICAALCAACVVFSAAVPASAAAGFSDVPENAWYADAVQKTTERGLLAGTGGGLFEPKSKVTRAMAVSVLWRLSGSPAAAGASSFSDVPADAWYSGAVLWAEQNGVASGNGKGLFKPESFVTREELAVFFYQYSLVEGLETAEGKVELYADANAISPWAKTGMRHALGAGLIRGSGNKLMPRSTATRGELAVMLERLMTPAAG